MFTEPSDTSAALTVVRVAVSALLDPAASLVQAAHAAAVFAARHPAADWASVTLVVYEASPRDLCALIGGAGGVPWCADSTASSAWFVEPDLLDEPTAFVSSDASLFDGLALYVPHHDRLPWRRSWLRSLATDLRRAGVDAEQLWAAARSFGDPMSMPVRARTACALCRTSSPPPEREVAS